MGEEAWDVPDESSTDSANDNLGNEDTGSMLSSSSLDGLSVKFEEALGIFAGLLEQARVVLDQTDFLGETLNADVKISSSAKSLVGALSFVTELADCVARSDDNQVKLVMCPMKYASAASDAFECIDNIMGENGANFNMFGFGGKASTTVAPAGAVVTTAPVPGAVTTVPAAGWGWN